MAKYFEGKNLIVEKFNKLGGKELLDKYIQYENENLLNKYLIYSKNIINHSKFIIYKITNLIN